MEASKILKDIQKNSITNKEIIYDAFETIRNKNPIIYNIETTNACNMHCKMCPRTTMMTRNIETLDEQLANKIINQIKPHNEELWTKWEEFVKKNYNIFPNDMSENHFFLYIIPQVIQLHGYGDPLLDKNIYKYVKMLTKKGIQSYFSCNPANINMNDTIKTFENGLSYIKYSIESTNDELHKVVRGYASNFTESYNKILKLLELKEKCNYNTIIVITMIDLHFPWQIEEYEKLKEAFAGQDVYIYFKSEDQQWYRKDYHDTKSVHWSEFCKHPWMSMTVKSNGEIAMCMEDYNNEIILGNAYKDALYDIWNNSNYEIFRKNHFNLTPTIKCTKECDMKLIGNLI